MSLAKRQRDKALELAVRELLIKGVPPGKARLEEGFLQFLPEILGEPYFQFRQQTRRANLKVDDQNKMFAEAANDLGLVYEENIETLERLLSQLALLEIKSRRYSSELRSLQKHLEDLLLTSEKATNFFFGVGDTFIDLSQVDQARSDIAVDVGAGLLTLAPDSRSNKIPLAHLLEQQSGSITITTPQDAIGRNVAGTKFGNAFEDTLTAWQYQVLTENQEPVEISIIIPVVARGQAPKTISRITLQGMNATPYTVLPLWSRDRVAFSQFSGISEPRLIIDEYAVLDVPAQAVTHIQLRLKKTGPDGEDEITISSPVRKSEVQGENTNREDANNRTSNNSERTDTTNQVVRKYATHFAFKNIGVWSMGFRRTGTFVSKTLVPQDSESLSTIGKVSLTVDEEVPSGTNLRYEIASNLEPEVFVPISPINNLKDSGPQVVDFSTVQRSTRNDNQFIVDNSRTPTSLGTIRGTEYFSIHTVADNVLDKTAKLWRGRNAWTCTREKDVRMEQVRNMVIDFSKSDTQRLFVFEEEERIINHGNSDGTSSLTISTRFPILFEGDDFNPSADLRTPGDISKPNFAIRKLIRRPVPGTINQAKLSNSTVSVVAAKNSQASEDQAQPASPTAGRAGAKVTITNFSSAALLGTTATGSVPDLYKSEFRLSYTSQGRTLSGVFTVESAQLLSGGDLELILDDPTQILETTTAAASVTWEVLSVNITLHITAVDGTDIILAEEQKIGTDDILEISYRRGLLPNESPISSSVIVKSSVNSTTVFREGVDYNLDQSSRTITRISAGGIQRSTDDASLSILIDFDYEATYLNLVTYKTYIYNSEETPKLTINKFTVDRENGEEVLLETNNGYIDIHNIDEIPPIAPGWHQVIVKSNPIRKDDGAVNIAAAIYKALTIKEIRTATDTGRFILPAEEHPDAGGDISNKFANYFTRQAAFLEPMQQVPFRQLSTSVRKTDRSVFSIKPASEAPVTSENAVVVNFDPRSSTDLLYMPPDIAGSGLPLDREDFSLEYSYVPADTDVITGIKFRATFEREPDVSEAASPILRSYNIRLAF